MFPSFAARIREQLPLLIEQADAQLGKLPGYDQLPQAARHELERRMLGLVADCIDTGSTVQLHQYIRERAAQVQARGIRLEAFQHAVIISQDVVTPLAETAPESEFAWRALTSTEAIVSGIINRELQRTIEEAETAKQALHESEQHLRTVVDFAFAWETWLLPDGHYVYVSPACQRISGYTAQEFIDRPELFLEIVHGVDRAVVEDHFFQHHTTEDTAPLEFRIVTRDGQVRWINHVCVPVSDAQGSFQGRRGSNIDVTERKLAEETASKNARLFQSLFEKSADAILLLEDGVFTDCNQATVEMMRAAHKQQFLSVHPSQLSPEYQPDGRPSGEKADEMIRTALEQGSHRFEWIHCRMDGSDFPVEVLLTPITIDQRQVIYTVWRDITRRKQLEQVWQQSLERRERQVQTSTEVAQDIAAAPALDELFTRVVTLIKERFGYYQAQIFRYDPAQNAVVLVVGYGEAGQKMLAGGHQLQMGRGVVGTAAATGHSILATNVADDKDWRPNPNLPATQGELAVPIQLRGEVLGILDVQSDQAGALTREDQLLLEGLCGQIAVAIESRRVEAALREREAQLSEALKIAKLAYWEYDVAHDRFLFNDQFYSIFHTTADQAGGYQLSSAQYAQTFVHPDDLPLVGSEIEKALSSTERHYTRQLEHRILYADGGVGHLSVSVNIDRDDQGNILRYYGANQDITEHKLAELELRKFKLGLDRSTSAIFITDQQGLITYVNPAFEKIYGYNAAEAIGQTPRILKSGVIPPEQYQHFWAALLSGQSVTGEIVNRTKDGRLIPIDGTNTSITDETGQIVGFLAMHADITERKEAGRKLTESERLLRTLIDAIPDYIYAKDLQGRHILGNAALARLYGLPSTADMIGKSDFDLYPRELAEQYWASEQPILQGGQSLIGHEEPNVDAEGHQKWDSTTKVPLRDEAGKIIGLVGITSDITPRKEVEEELRRAQHFLNSVLENLPIMVFVKEAQDLRFVRWNKAGEDLVGFAREDMLGKNDYDFFPQEEADFFVAKDREVLNGQILVDTPEEPIQTRYHGLRLLHTRKIPILDEQGHPQYLLGISEDITERKKEEQRMAETLREMERLYAMTSREEWQSYRESERLPDGYVYNRLEVQPAPQIWEPEIGQAIERHSTVESHTDQRSLIVTPLAVRGEIIGALGLYDKPDQPLTPEDVALVEAASEQVALALESARLFDQIQRDAEREHTLNRIATAINRSSSINELLPTALEIALEVIGFDCGLATLFDTETNTLRVVVQRDLPEEVVSHLKNGLGGTLCEYVFLQGQATLLEDMRQSAPLDVTGLVAQGLLSYVGIPLIYQDHTLGTLCMFSTTPKLLSEKMDTLLQSIGQQLGVGVTNARLLEQTQRDAERERTINRITSQIRNASSVDEVLEIAAQELSVLTHASRSVIEIAPGGSGQAGNGQTARHA